VKLPSVAGQLGAGFAILMLYVPALFWTHITHSGYCCELSARPFASQMRQCR
jgi:hypothetical protein